MANRFEPLGLAALAKIITAQELQALPQPLQAAIQNLRDPDLTAPSLTSLLLNDPALAANVMKEVSRQIRQRSHLSINSIAHCLTLLGMESTGTVVRMTRPLPTESKESEELQYREALVTSLHAAAQIGDWQRMLPLIHFEQAYLAGLLMRLPEWCLWRAIPKEMHMLEALVHRYAVPRQAAEKLVLGCTLNDIAVRIGQDWRLSDVMVNTLDTRLLPPLKALLRWARRTLRQRQAHISYRDEGMHRIEISGVLRAFLANWIAVEARHDWHGKGMRRCVLLLAAYLEISEEAAWTRIRDTALALAREVPDPMTAHLAAGLLWPAKGTPARRLPEPMREEAVQQLYSNAPVKTVILRARAASAAAVEKAVSSPVAEPTPTPSPAPLPVAPAATAGAQKKPGFASLEKQRQFEQHLSRLLGNGVPFKVEHEVIRTGVDVLRDCSALERIVIALVHLNRDNIVSYYAVGCEKAQGLRRFEIKLQPPNLFTRLVKQPAAIWLSPERQKETLGLMPGHFRQATQVDSCFIASLFNTKGPFAVLYADKGNSYGALSEADYQIFRMLVNGTNKNLMNMKT